MLDFATGTGTFLLEVFEQILAQLPKDAGNRDLLIKERLQKSMYGFEYLIAPYTVAHLKLSQYLKEQGYAMQQHERLHIYLTNTLEPADLVTQQIPFLPALTLEGRKAQEVKNKHILVITGNPPYSGISKNKGEWITDLIEDYKKLEGGEWKERKHWLGDDYVKFIRFAQFKMEYETVYDEKSKSYINIPNDKDGIVAIITNHSFLDNPTFNGMRQSLLKTFDHLYFLDLHGNYKKKEKNIHADDENVFDQIQQGVAISILVKNKNLEKKVFHADWCKREDKYQRAWETEFKEVEWKEIKPNHPFYFFIPKSETDRNEYEKYWKVNEIFLKSTVGFVTGRDEIALDFSRKELFEKLKKFSSISNEEARQKFNTGKDSRDWTVLTAQSDVKNNLEEKNIIQVLYRPFNSRFTLYTGNSRGLFSSPQRKIMKNL